ncbi:hypothetical protein NF27_CG01460 [Candidatus Jidaibacter acanthamoeba]|uniref:Uncharacterized protein n=1 Tax=Candidatus Jidaibacter acanthamoebae TaxID=86105 RepID=A0A0C1N0Y4_9RICK|nr:hypothetical protein [Candidatus Jidaibacter acanthamoeba]KIE05966.1 hypothetical protein NF27_CG01460 [Candidatus Jidaibacter acanthamoeba]
MRANIIYYIIILITMLGAPTSILAETKNNDKPKYPPYPDIWGYDLTDYKRTKDTSSIISAYLAPSGDIVFTFHIEDQTKNNFDENDYNKNTWLAALKFFTGEIVEIGLPKNLDAFVEDNKLVNIGSREIELKDGTMIIYDYDSAGRLCQSNNLVRSSLLIGKPRSGEEWLYRSDDQVKKFSIIEAMPDIFRDYDRQGVDPCPRGGKIIYKQLYFLPSTLIKLKDDTFIAFNSSGNLIVRFNKDLDTKFKPHKGIKGMDINKNLFIIPYSVIENIYDQVIKEEEYGVQGVHDRLLLYFQDEEKEK